MFGNSLILADVAHGLIHNYSRKRRLVPAEHLVAQALAVWHRIHGSELPFFKALGVLASCDLKKLAGNGMYLPLIGYQLMYVLAYTTKKPKTFRSNSNARMASVPTLDGTPEYWRRLSGGDLLGYRGLPQVGRRNQCVVSFMTMPILIGWRSCLS